MSTSVVHEAPSNGALQHVTDDVTRSALLSYVYKEKGLHEKGPLVF
jgi:hypothetical protein